MKTIGINVVLGLLILAVLLLAFANVWLALQSYILDKQLSKLVDQQAELIERNKRLITGISVLRSPSRIISEAQRLGMHIPDVDQLIVIQGDP